MCQLHSVFIKRFYTRLLSVTMFFSQCTVGRLYSNWQSYVSYVNTPVVEVKILLLFILNTLIDRKEKRTDINYLKYISRI